jgi:hypothetical protein
LSQTGQGHHPSKGQRGNTISFHIILLTGAAQKRRGLSQIVTTKHPAGEKPAQKIEIY